MTTCDEWIWSKVTGGPVTGGLSDGDGVTTGATVATGVTTGDELAVFDAIGVTKLATEELLAVESGSATLPFPKRREEEATTAINEMKRIPEMSPGTRR